MTALGRRPWLAAVLVLLVAAAPAAAASPCHCPEEIREAPNDETSSACHATPSPEASRDTTSPHPEAPDGGACQGTCGACATVAGLTEAGPDPTPFFVVDRIAGIIPAMREGESRPPDHVPLPL